MTKALPVRQQEDPIRAVRAGLVRVARDGTVGVHGLYRQEPYPSLDSHATCYAYTRTEPDGTVIGEEVHDAPAPGCTCGFYAFGPEHGARPELENGTTWTLDVELYGRVIRHKLGYRAARQRILKLRAPVVCAGAPPLATGPFTAAPAGSCEKWARYLVTGTSQSAWPEPYVGGFCLEHARTRLDAGGLPIAPRWIANRLGVEIDAWNITAGEPPPAPPAPPDVTVNGGAGAGSWWDQLPPEVGDMIRRNGSTNQVTQFQHFVGGADQMLFTVQTSPDRVELRMTVNGWLAWQRALFYGPSPYPGR